MLNKAKKIIAWCWATMPRKIISCLVIAGILLSSLWFLFFKPAPVEAGWWDEDWLYRRVVTVTNNTTAETDVYVEITSIDTSDAGKVQADCGDLRFTKIDGTQLDYYIVSGCGTSSTTIHVKLDMLQAGAQTIYFYYGNSSVVNGFIGTDFSTVASDYSVGAIGSEEIGLGPVLWLKFDEGYGAFAYNSTDNDAGKLPGTQLDTTHPLADGLVGLWLMNEGSGDKIFDLSGNGNTGTRNGAGTIWITSKFGSAQQFNGSSDWNSISTPPIIGAQNRTIIAWIRTGTTSTDIISWGVSTSSGNHSRVGITSAGRLFFGVAGGNAGFGVVNDNIWHQVAITTNGSLTDDVLGYVDGKSSTRDSLSSQTINTINANGDIGRRSGDDDRYFLGQIDHILIYNRTLSASEIAELYAEPFAMISDTGASRISGASWTDFGKFDKALDFNGNGDVVTVIRDASVNFQNKSAYSISTWIYPHSDGKNDVGKIIDKGVNTYIQVVNEGADGYLDLQAGLNLDSSDPTLTIENAVRINRWSHILLVWKDDVDDDEFTIYVNGINMGISSGGSGVPADDSGTDLLIGGDAIGGDATASFDGIIDEVIIYPYARDVVQVKRSYNQGAAARIGRDDSWITDGLVGYWKMDESSGTASDSSGAGTTLINEGTATFTGGKFANGASLNGSSQYFQVADNTTLSITGDIVLSAWVYANTVSGTDVIVGKWDGSNETYLLFLEEGKPRMYIDSSSNYQTTDSATVSTSTWTLVTGVYDASAGKVRLYINGREENSSTTGTIPFSIGDDAGVFHIGAEDSTGGAANFFDGKIDDVRVYNRELSGFEVRRLYDWGPPPVAHWTFDEGSGTSANDSSENSNTGTLTGDSTWKGSAECKYGNCLDFDGAGDYVAIANENNFEGFENFTISAWINLAELGGYYTIFSKKYTAYEFIINNGSQLFLEGTINGNRVRVNSGGMTVSANTWHHVVFVWNGDATTVDFYLDGDSVVGTCTTACTETGSFDTNSETPNIGGIRLDFNGTIDDVKIYNYARTQKQIIEDMMGGRPAITETTSSPGVTMGYWKFDEGFGTTAYDASGRSNNLTHSAEAYTMSGKFGKAWDGNGTKYLSIADDSDFDFAETEDFSISGWFKHSPISSSNDYIITKYELGTAGGYKIYMDSDGDIAFAIDDDGTWDTGDIIGDDQGRNYDDNSWHYFAAVKKGTSSMRLYIDGREIDNDTSLAETGSLANAASLYIGVDANGSTGPFDGELDEIKIYRFALSPEEILLDYNKGKSVIMGAVGTELQGVADQKPAFGTSGSQLNTDHPLAQGLVGLWLMNEGSGTSIADLSGNGNIGTITNATWATSKFGLALYFDGIGDYGVIPSFNVVGGMTISAWINFEEFGSGSDQDIVLRKGVAYSNTGNVWLLQIEDRFVNFVIKDLTGPPNTNNFYGDTTLDPNIWYHIVGTYDGTTMRIYVDGDEDGNIAAPEGIAFSSNDINIGGRPDGSDASKGIIDHIIIYNRALSAEEIAWLYAEPFAMLNLPTVPSYGQSRAYCPPGHVGLCNPPVGEYKFDEYTGSTAYDTSGNTNNGAISGASWKGSADCKYNSCLDFDGTDDVVTVTEDSSINMTGKSGYTMSAWIYPHSDGENDVGEIIDKGSNTYLRLDTGSDGLDVEAKLDLVTADATLNISNIIFPNNWYHIVMTYEDDSDDEITIYINGANQGSSTDGVGSLAASDTNDLLIGGDTNANFDGIIDDVKIFDYALSQEQVAWVYNKGKPVGQWKFDEGEGPITYNSTTNDGGKLPGLRLDTDHSLSNGLVGLWLMNENTGTTVADLSGNGYTGTLVDLSWGAGKFGSVIEFPDTLGDTLDMPPMPVITTGRIAISFWFRIDRTYADTSFQGLVDHIAGVNGSRILIWTDGELFGQLYVGGNQRNLEYLGPIHSINTWYHVVFQYTGTHIELYVNGKFNNSYADDAGLTTNPQGLIFGEGYDNNWPLDGALDNIFYYNRALSATEIAQLYAEPFAMISDTGASLITEAVWSSGRYNSALDFDGVDDVVTVAVDSDIDLNNKTGYSVCGWIAPDSDGQGDAGEWFSKGNSYIRVDTESGSTVEVSALFDLATDASLNTTQTIPIGSWSHICTTWKNDDDDELTIYINGMNAGSSTNGSGAPADDSDSHLNIGGDDDKNFDGDIDEVTIYNYELTSQQVKLDYNQGSALRFGD